MSGPVKDGGPAFPLPTTEWAPGNPGMSLRDWFAGQALAGMGTWVPIADILDSDGCAIPAHMPSYQRKVQEARAEWAYAQADAMLAERGKRG